MYLPAEHRFVATVDGSEDVAFLDVVPATTVWTFAHTEVPESLSGFGIGSALVKAALDHARAVGVNVIPRCPFVAAYMRRHPEEQDLITDRYKFLVEKGR
ncbi:MAG TPA: GNAT family N-acetyltransferase [Trueperaceae bacterium]|nr:GNAT family N-acetyltransferase [Trueperaceae bacterium]